MSDLLKKPWRKRWPGRRCMKIQIRDERGGEFGMETHLTEAQYTELTRICAALVADEIEADSVRNQPAPRSGT